jgi:hypothetical protein
MRHYQLAAHFLWRFVHMVVVAKPHTLYTPSMTYPPQPLPSSSTAREAITSWLVVSLFAAIQLSFITFGFVLVRAGQEIPGPGLQVFPVFLFLHSAVAALIALAAVFIQNRSSGREQIYIGLGFAVPIIVGLISCVALFHLCLSRVAPLEWLSKFAQCTLLFAALVLIVRLVLRAIIPKPAVPFRKTADIATDTFG